MNEHTVEAALQYFIRHNKMTEKTKSGYTNTLKKVREFGFGSIVVTDLTAAKIRDFLEHLRLLKYQQGKFKGSAVYKESSIYMIYTQMSAAVNFYAGEHGLVTAGNISSVLKAPHIHKGKLTFDADDYYDSEQIKTLMQMDIAKRWQEVFPGVTCPTSELIHARKLAVLQSFTGMVGADLSQIDDLKSHIATDKKGREWFQYTRKKSKRKCVIPVTTTLRQVIDDLAQCESLMPWLQRRYQEYCNHLGKLMGKPATPKTFRHAFGVLMIEAGMSLESVRQMMGHSSIKVTEQCYAQITEKRIVNEFEDAEAMLESISGNF